MIRGYEENGKYINHSLIYLVGKKKIVKCNINKFYLRNRKEKKRKLGKILDHTRQKENASSENERCHIEINNNNNNKKPKMKTLNL